MNLYEESLSGDERYESLTIFYNRYSELFEEYKPMVGVESLIMQICAMKEHYEMQYERYRISDRNRARIYSYLKYYLMDRIINRIEIYKRTEREEVEWLVLEGYIRNRRIANKMLMNNRYDECGQRIASYYCLQRYIYRNIIQRGELR